MNRLALVLPLVVGCGSGSQVTAEPGPADAAVDADAAEAPEDCEHGTQRCVGLVLQYCTTELRWADLAVCQVACGRTTCVDR